MTFKKLLPLAGAAVLLPLAVLAQDAPVPAGSPAGTQQQYT